MNTQIKEWVRFAVSNSNLLEYGAVMAAKLKAKLLNFYWFSNGDSARGGDIGYTFVLKRKEGMEDVHVNKLVSFECVLLLKRV